jgi:hypothetical protein
VVPAHELAEGGADEAAEAGQEVDRAVGGERSEVVRGLGCEPGARGLVAGGLRREGLAQHGECQQGLAAPRPLDTLEYRVSGEGVVSVQFQNFKRELPTKEMVPR